MLILATTSDKIEVVTGQAVTVDIHASFVDWNGTVATPGNKNTLISAAATTQVVDPPAASAFRTVKSLVVRNRHASLSVDVTVRHVATAGIIISELLKITLVAGQTLIWVEGEGFVVVNVGAFLPLTGGTLTGDLVLPADPTTALQAVTKQYVDARFKRLGTVTLGGAATSMNLTGLSVGINKKIRVVINVQNATAGGVSVHLRVNGDADNTDYVSQILNASGATASAVRIVDSARVGNMAASRWTGIVIDILILNNGRVLMFANGSRDDAADAVVIESAAVAKQTVVTSITQVSLVADTASGLASGSQMVVYEEPTS